MQRARDRGEGSWEPGAPAQRSAQTAVQSGLLLCSARGQDEPGFPLVGAWEGPRSGRAGPARLCAAPGGTRAASERLGRPRRCWRCSRWSCGSATRRARTSGSGCLGRWPTSSSPCWPSSRYVSAPRPGVPPAGACQVGQLGSKCSGQSGAHSSGLPGAGRLLSSQRQLLALLSSQPVILRLGAGRVVVSGKIDRWRIFLTAGT